MTRPLRILLVEDCPLQARLIDGHLAAYGARSGFAFELTHVRRLADVPTPEAAAFDAVLLDMTLGPDEGPDRVLEAIARHAFPGPVVAMTGWHNLEPEARAAGACGFIRKGLACAEEMAQTITAAALGPRPHYQHA